MNKLKVLFATGLLGLAFITHPNYAKVNAEEIVEPPVEEVVVEEEQTEEEFIEQVKGWLGQYVQQDILIKIISWAVDAGVLTALFAVVVKYRKYKHTTLDDLMKMFKDQIGNHLKDNFVDLGKNEIKAVVDKVCDLENSVETIMKVLVLMQDNTKEGKVALLEYLGAKTKNVEIVEQAKVETEKLEKEIENTKELVAKVQDDYKEIF